MDTAATGIAPTDSMGAAGQKMLRLHRAALLTAAEGVRAGHDAQAVRRMRVADRRIRAVLHMLGPYVPGPAVRRMLGDLRTLHDALGAVRDLDVLIGLVRADRGTLAVDAQAGPDELLAEWRTARKRARKGLRRALDSSDYRRFRERLDAFLDEGELAPDQEAGVAPYQVRHVAGSAIWQRYEAVRAYEMVAVDPSNRQLHGLRIAGKYLRYTLEFFSEVLPPAAGPLIRDLVALQDQLGALHDADVLVGLVREHGDKRAERRHGRAPATPPGLAAYLATRAGAIAPLRAGAAVPWATVGSPAWRARLATVVAAI